MSANRLPPRLPGGLPFLGHALELRRDPVRLLYGARQRFGDICSFQLAGRRVAFFCGPEANEAYLRAPGDQLSAKAAYRFTVPIFGPGVAYDATEERMSEQVDMVLPALTERRLRLYAGFIQEEIDDYLKTWGDSGVLDLSVMCNSLTVFIASRCLIGRQFRSNLSEEFARLYHDLEGGINLLAFFLPNLPLPSFRRRDRARVRLVELIGGIIRERRQSGQEEEDFLQTLMTARYSDGLALSEEAITGILLTLIFAGQHTSAIQAAWAGVELLQHPDYLERVLREQDDVMGDREELTFDALRDMEVLDRGIQESERLHPPLILLVRQVLREFHYRDYVIPAGDLAMISPAVAHRLPHVFADPERYDPDRFGPGREEHRKARHAIITFGGGKHGCIGLTFAYLQVKAIWSALLRRYELRLLDGRPKPNYATFVVGPQTPCRIAYQQRKRELVAGGWQANGVLGEVSA